MNRVFSGTILALALLILLPFPARPGNPISPLGDEKNLIDQISPAPEADGLFELGRFRLQHAAALYKTWLDNKRDEDFFKALVYAHSASELLVDSDEAWLLLGMLRAELKTEPSALAAATDALVRAVESNPANGRAQLVLAQVLMEQGRYWSAIEQFKILIEGSRAMRTGTVLSQLTFCYIADKRIQAGLDYIHSLINTKPQEGTGNQWLEWQLINTAILMKAKGDRKDAIGYLNLMFFYGGKEDANHQRSDGRIKQVKYLLSLWEKGE